MIFDSAKNLRRTPTMLYVAIDQHSKQFTVNERDEQGDVTLRRQVSTMPDASLKYVVELEQRGQAQGGYVAILEVCGFNDWLIELLRAHGCRDVLLVQPEERGKRKTDRRDANKLGELLWTNRDRLLAGKPVHGVRRVEIPTLDEAADRQLTALRQNTGRRRTRVLNRITRLLFKHNLQHGQPTKHVKTKRCRAWLKELALPEMDRFEMDQLLEEWGLVEGHLKAQEDRIRQRQAQSPRAATIATVPGFSSYASLAVASRVGRLDRFPRGASLANFFGLAPGCRNSGESKNRIGNITKQGSAIVRHLLGQAVLHVLRKDAWMRKRYQEIKHRRGTKVARVAVMRRLATVIWCMLRHNLPYLSGGPQAFRQALANQQSFDEATKRKIPAEQTV
jgi:transposase